MTDIEFKNYEQLLALKRKIDEKLKQLCIYCGEKAEYLCDFKIGYDREVNPIYKSSKQAFTCDAPLCERHRVNQCVIDIKGVHIGECYETIDHCCNGHEYSHKLKPMTYEQAHKLRLEHYSRSKQ